MNIWYTDVVPLLLPSGQPSDDLKDELNALEARGIKIYQIIVLPNTQQAMIVSRG